MNNQQSGKKPTQTQKLKELYPQVAQRQAYAMKRLNACKLKNPAIVRVEPLNHKVGLPIHFSTLLLEKTQKMGIINSLICRRLKIDSKTSIFCFVGQKNKSLEIWKEVGEVYDQYKEEDGILYINYTDHLSF